MGFVMGGIFGGGKLGRLILTNSCLSSAPAYIMGSYLLNEGHHKELDSIRGRFFRQGVKFKYHTW